MAYGKIIGNQYKSRISKGVLLDKHRHSDIDMTALPFRIQDGPTEFRTGIPTQRHTGRAASGETEVEPVKIVAVGVFVVFGEAGMNTE